MLKNTVQCNSIAIIPFQHFVLSIEIKKLKIIGEIMFTHLCSKTREYIIRIDLCFKIK